MRGLFEYFGVNSPLPARVAQAKCAPALVKPGAVVREYSDEVAAIRQSVPAGEGSMDELVSVSGWCYGLFPDGGGSL